MNLTRLSRYTGALFLLLTFSFQLGCQKEQVDDSTEQNHHAFGDDLESETEFQNFFLDSCVKAKATQIATVDLGLTKSESFLRKCYQQTGSQKWCDQIVRPNPESREIFHCTYSLERPHIFVHPDESTWHYAFEAINLVQELEAKNIKVSLIYNWWRPEPYNANVGGVPQRHPYGTSVDVRFVNKTEQNKAHEQLCKWRSQGRLKALGHYSGTGLHFGMGDSKADTWGKACP